MTPNPKQPYYRLLAPVLLAMLLSALCLFVFDRLTLPEAQGQYTDPTETPLPGPYPGVPTSTPQPTQPTLPSVTKPALTPSTQLSATPTISGTLPLTGTLNAAPQPTLDLLFAGDLPQSASQTPVIIYVREPAPVTTGIVLGAPARLLIVIVILLWGLLGTFLVVYIRRLGY